jgi:UTP--glucose-1-phosphate uridylyltransferase
VDGLFRVESLVEKPSPADAPSTLAIAARYVLAPDIFDALDRTAPGKGGEIQLTDGIRLLIEQGRPVYGICLTEAERRFDIGNFDAYFRAFVEFSLADPKHGPGLREFVRRIVDADHP